MLKAYHLDVYPAFYGMVLRFADDELDEESANVVRRLGLIRQLIGTPPSLLHLIAVTSVVK